MKNAPAKYIIIGWFFLDRLLKWLSLHDWNQTVLINKWFGWHPFFNTGIAFGLPLPIGLNIFSSAVIIVLLIVALSRVPLKDRVSKYAMTYIVLGAFSNFYDRTAYGGTLDYLQIITGVFNIADFMIMWGFITIIFNHRATTPKN